MMRLFRQLRLLVPCLLGAGFITCTTIEPEETSSIGGTGSEVVGVVEYPDSSETSKIRAGLEHSALPVIDGPVFINPENYLADTGNAEEEAVAWTEDDGSFVIRNVKAGTHIIYIRDNDGKAIAHRVTVHENEPRVDVGTLFAKPTAGVAIAYTGSTPGDVLFYIDIRGTGLQLRCASRNLQFTLDRIPVGTDYSVVIRLFKPLKNGYEFSLENPIPGIVSTLQSFTGE
ncbi:MAG: hypothetical protein JW863_14350 [Chitinispirillaceae bacterium]|nr:hypothetical protein [Chitinispirillaceae bacterium]